MNKFNQYPGAMRGGARPQLQQLQRPQPMQQAAPKKASGGMLGGMMGGMSMSDERSKKEIERLSSTNDALMQALDDAHQNTPEGNMPETEYPKLPSHTSFSPADRVAAQNVGIQAASAPQQPPQAAPQGMQANPQQQNFARSQNPAFNVGAPMPDMSALDEAYRRQGMGG